MNKNTHSRRQPGILSCESDSAAPRFDLNSQGFGLVEVMIAGVVMALVMLGMATMSSNFNRSMLGTRTAATRTELSATVARHAGSGESLLKSIDFTGGDGFPSNASLAGNMFAMCAKGGTPGGCQTGPTPYDLMLTDAMGTPIAGPPSNPAVYDVNGKLCGSGGNGGTHHPDKTCPIIASVQFVPICPNNTSPCDQAAAIDVYYKIGQAPGIELAAGSRMATINQHITNAVPFTITDPSGQVANSLAMWITSSQLGSSSVYQLGNNIGIDQTSPDPTYKLDVNGRIRATGPIVVGSSITGGNCGPEGAFAYDGANHTPIYCDPTGHWTPMGGGALKYGGQFEVKWVGNPNGLGDPAYCWNPNPATSGCTCPAGYNRFMVGMTFHYVNWDGAGFVCWSN